MNTKNVHEKSLGSAFGSKSGRMREGFRISSIIICGLIGLILSAGSLLAVEPIPPEKRIPATRVGALSAPTDSAMHIPTDVIVDSGGRAFVADGANHRVLRFTPTGSMDLVITEPGGQKLNRPLGLTINPDNHLIIADTGNHRLLITSLDGQLIRTLDLPEKDKKHPAGPTDVVVTPDGQRTYIVDNPNHRLIVLEHRNRLFNILGQYGRSLGQFQWPFMIALGPDGYVAVTEVIGTRIQRVSPAGKWTSQIGHWGIRLGQFYRPKGIAVDAAGKIFVGDSTLNAIQVFSPEGVCQGALTDPAGQILRFAHPMGMCFDAAGRLYVVELGADRVAILTLEPPSAGPVKEGTP